MVTKLPQDEYDKLSKDEQQAHDKALAEQEKAEQEGERASVIVSFNAPLMVSSPQPCHIAGSRHFKM